MGQAIVLLEKASSNQVTDGLARRDSGSIEARNRSADFVGNTVGHRCHEGRKHDVVSQLGRAPQQEDHREGVLVQRKQCHRATGNETTDDDPGSALAEARTRQIRESPENNVCEQSNYRTHRVDCAQHRFFASSINVFKHCRQNHGGQGDPGDRAGNSAERETDTETDEVDPLLSWLSGNLVHLGSLWLVRCGQPADGQADRQCDADLHYRSTLGKQ